MLGKRRSRQEYKAIFAEMERSGLSLYAYARKTGLPYSTLLPWKRRLAGEAKKAKKAKKAKTAKTADSPPRFLPVTVAGPVPAETRALEGCEVRLRGGHEIRVPPGFDAATLVALIKALESSACSR